MGLNSGIRQSRSSMPEYTKLQHTIQVQATKLITYSIQYKYITYNAPNISGDYVQRGLLQAGSYSYMDSLPYSTKLWQ